MRSRSTMTYSFEKTERVLVTLLIAAFTAQTCRAQVALSAGGDGATVSVREEGTKHVIAI